jgi:hypothetical protein
MIVPLLALALAGATAHAHPCRAALPRGPAVPTPVILRTSCGGYELATDGRVSQLSRHWFAKHGGGTGRRYGADISVRRTHGGRFILLRHGQVVWRSRGLYRNDGADVVFGPHEFAFAAYRRGVFLTDLHGPERLVLRGRGLYPYDFTRSGQLLVVSTGRVDVVGREGRVLRGYRFRQANGLGFDPRREELFFVAPNGTLAAAEGTRLRLIRRLTGVEGQMTFSPPGVLLFVGQHSLTVAGLDGRVVARASWPRSPLDVFDSGTSVSPDGRSFAFRLSNARSGAKSGAAVVYVLRRGQSQAQAVYRHRLGPSGCAVGANLSWHGGSLLYSSVDGERLIIDTADDHVLDLASLARSLPRLSPRERANAYWGSDFH